MEGSHPPNTSPTILCFVAPSRGCRTLYSPKLQIESGEKKKIDEKWREKRKCEETKKGEKECFTGSREIGINFADNGTRSAVGPFDSGLLQADDDAMGRLNQPPDHISNILFDLWITSKSEALQKKTGKKQINEIFVLVSLFCLEVGELRECRRW